MKDQWQNFRTHLNFDLANFIRRDWGEPFESFGVLILPNKKIFVTHANPAKRAEFKNCIGHPRDGAREASEQGKWPHDGRNIDCVLVIRHKDTFCLHVFVQFRELK